MCFQMSVNLQGFSVKTEGTWGGMRKSNSRHNYIKFKILVIIITDLKLDKLGISYLYFSLSISPHNYLQQCLNLKLSFDGTLQGKNLEGVFTKYVLKMFSSVHGGYYCLFIKKINKIICLTAILLFGGC